MVRKLLIDAQWKRIEQMLPGKPGDMGRTGPDNRLFVEAVLWIARIGNPWRDLPDEFGNGNSAYVRFARWSRGRVAVGVRRAGQGCRFPRSDDRFDPRARPPACGWGTRTLAQALGRSRGGLTSKIHLIADRRGRPARGSLTAGQVNDVTQALPLLSGLRFGALIGDRAYDANAVVDHAQGIGARAVLPPRCNRRHQRRFSRKAYRRRNLIERCFCRLKQFHRIATPATRNWPSASCP